jgi:LPPG:FO 2-phospho-L-lactate transferase
MPRCPITQSLNPACAILRAMIVVLTGGTGGAKFLQGLAAVMPQREIAAIINTGDDLICWGLHVSPDIDSVTYGLGGRLSRERGWGREGETFHCLEAAQALGLQGWFQLGDRDLGLHLARTEMLRAGRTLSEATDAIARRLGVEAKLLPMSDDRVETRVMTAGGELSFQEYFVRERYQPQPLAVRFVGAEAARPAPGVPESIGAAEMVIVAPSNPITSIGPILAVPGIRAALRQTRAPVAAISPIVGGKAVSGPAGALMQLAGLPVSCTGVAQAYEDFLDVLIADERDAGPEVPGVRAHFCAALMDSDEAKARLARETLESLRQSVSASVNAN